ncbi:uncharacterized [Tachysurus ichikawai]
MKDYMSRRYSTDTLFQKMIKDYMFRRYSTDTVYQNKIKDCMVRRYSTDTLFQRKMKDYMFYPLHISTAEPSGGVVGLSVKHQGRRAPSLNGPSHGVSSVPQVCIKGYQHQVLYNRSQTKAVFLAVGITTLVCIAVSLQFPDQGGRKRKGKKTQLMKAVEKGLDRIFQHEAASGGDFMLYERDRLEWEKEAERNRMDFERCCLDLEMRRMEAEERRSRENRIDYAVISVP